MIDLHYREATLGKSREEQALMEIDRRHAAEYQRLLDLNATKDQLDLAERTARAERDDLEQEQKLEKERQYREKTAALDQEFGQIKKQQYNAAWQGVSGMGGQVGGEMGAGLGMMTTGLKGMADVAAGEDPHSAEIERLKNHYNEKLTLMAEHGATTAELQQAAADMELQIEQQKEQRKLSIASSAAGTMAGVMQTLAQTQGKHSKKAFAAYKAFAIAQTIIDTYKGAQAAFSAFAGMGPYGIALGAAAAAVAVAAGMARVKAIRSQQPGGGGSAASAGAGGGGVSAPSGMSTALPSTGMEKPAQAAPAITLVINGKETHIGELTGNVLEELYRNNGSVGGFTVAMERSA